MKSKIINKKIYDNTMTNFELLLQMICNYIVLVTSTQNSQGKITVKYFKDTISAFVKSLDELHIYEASKIKVNKASEEKPHIAIVIQVYIKETKDSDFSVLEFEVKKNCLDYLEKNLTKDK